ncbi:MAG: hypothetical protein LUC25_07065 [Ruminococcus sp.]|nr:hypothetical protein [Ruminococcus sp.]
MAELSARFKLIDEMSDKLSQMATAGQQTTESWESVGEAANLLTEYQAGNTTNRFEKNLRCLQQKIRPSKSVSAFA